MNTAELARFLRTVRHLKPSQVAWRLKRQLLPLPRPPEPHDLGVATDFPDTAVSTDPHWDEAPALLERLEGGDFQIFDKTRSLGYADTDWLLGPRTTDRLWTITLHYHFWAYQLAGIARRDRALAPRAATLFSHYLGSWVSRCACSDPAAQHLAWNSFAIATRIGWWTRAYHEWPASFWSTHGEFRDQFLKSLWQQAWFLSRNLEWDLRANHLLRDAVGLAWAGRFFSGPDAEHWLEQATRLTCDQVEEQVLPDGGHFERSPMYHLQALAKLSTLASLLTDEGALSALRCAAERMAEFSAWVRHPDGNIPLLNDATSRGGPHPRRLLEKCADTFGVPIDSAPRQGARFFQETGLVVWHRPPWSVFFDVGPLGPDHQPGHGHADSLTIEVSYKGERLFADPGTYGYDADEHRAYDRSTAAHNTVCMDGLNSSEVWHRFRVGRRAKPFDVKVVCDEKTLRASAAHTGYQHLRGAPVHRRELMLREGGEVHIVDLVEGGGQHTAQGGFLVAPGWRVETTERGWDVFREDTRIGITVESEQPLEIGREDAWYHPAFGEEITATRLAWSWQGELPLRIDTTVLPM